MHKINLALILLTAGLTFTACTESATEVIQTETTPQNQTVQQQTKQQISAMPKKSGGKHTLWRIQGKNGNTLYLVGSIHLMKPDAYPLPDIYQVAFDDAENLVFEIDEEIQDPHAAQQAVSAYAGIEGAKRLSEKIDAVDYAEIKRLAKENKIPMLMIEPFDPWFSSMNLAVMQYMNAGMSPEHGIDQYFMRMAQDKGKSILGLETIDEQFGIFDSVSYGLQVEMLKETLSEHDQIDELIDVLDKSWHEGDMETLYEVLIEEFNQAPELYDKLLKQRNENWIPKLLPMLEDEDDYMVVVGTAHMLGEDGVLTLLEKEGYTAEQL